MVIIHHSCDYDECLLAPILSLKPPTSITMSQESISVMPSALILVADGSEEIEFITVYDGKLVQPTNKSRRLISLM